MQPMPPIKLCSGRQNIIKLHLSRRFDVLCSRIMIMRRRKADFSDGLVERYLVDAGFLGVGGGAEGLYDLASVEKSSKRAVMTLPTRQAQVSLWKKLGIDNGWETGERSAQSRILV